MARHRVPPVGNSLRRVEDPARSSDPQIRSLVAALSTLEIAPPPQAHFRAELRAQLVAVTPRLVTEGPLEDANARSSVAQTEAQRSSVAAAIQQTASRLRSLHLGRPLGVAVAAFTLFAALVGGAVFLSNKALPGDPLYGVKRASEDARLSMTHGVQRGKTLTDMATTRVDEVQGLLGKSSALAVGYGPTAAAGISPNTARLVTKTLASADSNTSEASRIFTSTAVSKKQPAVLDNMTNWAPGQISALNEVVARIPAGALHDRAVKSLHLVKAADARALALKPLIGCTCMSNAPSDALGPIPCTKCDAPTPSVTPGPTSGATTPGAPRSTGGPTPNGAHSPANPTSGGTLPTGGSTTPGVPVPSGLPTTGLPTGILPSGLPTSALPTLPLPRSGLPHLPLPAPSTPTSTCTGLLGGLGGILNTCKSP